MRTETVKRKGRDYLLVSDTEKEPIEISINGIVAKHVYYNEKRKVWYAPFKLEEGNFWVIVYNNKPYLSIAGDNLSQDAFEKNYILPAYNIPISIIWMMFGIIIPNAVYKYFITLLGIGVLRNSHILFSMLAALYYLLMNSAPITTVKKRRLLCLWILVFLLAEAMIIGLGLLY